MQNRYLKRTWAEIDLDALSANFGVLRGRVPSSAEVCAVVKADAYGHGSAFVARALESAGCASFAVSNTEEAVVLRRSGVSGAILVLGEMPEGAFSAFWEEDITATVASAPYAAALSAAAGEAGKTVKVHIKAETGMGRLGLRCCDGGQISKAAEEAEAICALPGLDARGLYTHFATADEAGDTLTPVQFERFSALREKLASRGVRLTAHCSNSAAALRYPEFSLDLVRPGIALYGLYPDGRENSELFSMFGLRPVMCLKSAIVSVSSCKAGSTVSYGAYPLPRDSEIAVLPAGYADGFSWRNSRCGTVLINGRPAAVTGRVCMDMTMADVTGLGVKPGDTALLFGTDRETGAALSAELAAEQSGTLNYELVCSVGRRVPRVYYQNGRETACSGLLGCFDE